MTFLTQAGVYLVTVVFEIFLLAVMLRFLFQLLRIDFYNPIAQFSVALTNPVLRPLRRILPGLFGIDIASVVLMVAVKALELTLLGLLIGYAPEPISLAIRTVRDLLIFVTNVFLFAIIARALLSWVVPYGGQGNPIMGVLVRLTEPLMRPARRLIPPIGGLDISPIAAIVALSLLSMFIQHLFGSRYLS